MNTYQVELGQRSYPIHIGAGLLGQPQLLRERIRGDSALVVTNTTVGPLYLAPLLDGLDGLRTGYIELPDGESYKNLDTLNSIYDKLLGGRFDRQTTLIALGGGVVGDITGFAAATYQRGVDFIQVPTTLLAQVDSSVGGKTGINHAQGKNMIGAFMQPRCVIADTDTLSTLDDLHLRSGLAEVVKYGLIRDRGFFDWLESNRRALLARDAAALTHAIERSCANKAEVVAADELEHGQRALLNLGHTFGHAIEAGAGYGQWSHGEAVAAGMCMAARMSRRLGWLDAASLNRIEALIEAMGLPSRPPPGISPDRFMQLMAVDKKARGGRIVLVLMHAIGESVVTGDYADQALHDELAASAGHAA